MQSSLQSPSNLSSNSFGGAHDYPCPSVDDRNDNPIPWTHSLPSYSGDYACGFDAHHPWPTVSDQSDHQIPSTHTLPDAGHVYKVDARYSCPTVDVQSKPPIPSHTLDPNSEYFYPWIPNTIPDPNAIGVDQRSMTPGDSFMQYRGAASIDCHTQYYPIQDIDARYNVRTDSHHHYPYHPTYPTYGTDSVWSNLSYSSWSGYSTAMHMRATD